MSSENKNLDSAATMREQPDQDEEEEEEPTTEEEEEEIDDDEDSTKVEEDRSTGSVMELRKVRKVTAKKRILDSKSSESEPLAKIKKKGAKKKNKIQKKEDSAVATETNEEALEREEIDEGVKKEDSKPEEKSDIKTEDKEEDSNTMTLEQFTDIVLASEGMMVEKKKGATEESNNEKDEVKKPVVLEPIAVKEENNNKPSAEMVASLIQSNNDLIVEVKPMRPKPVVLSPRQPPGSHMLPHHQRTGKVSLSSSVVVSVKPRLQPKPAVLPPQNRPQKIPQRVEEWLSKIEQPLTSNPESGEALNLSTKSAKPTQVYLKPHCTASRPSTTSPVNIPAAKAVSDISSMPALTISSKLWPPGHPKRKALMALDKQEQKLKQNSSCSLSQYSPKSQSSQHSNEQTSPSPIAKLRSSPPNEMSPPRLEITKVDRLMSPPPLKKIGRALPIENSLHLENVRARAIRDVQLAHVKDMHGNYPIHMSVLMRKPDLVRRYCCILQVLESSLDLLNEDRMTPLHLAVRDQSLEIIEILLAFGANPKIKDKSGNTSLHTAAASKSGEMLQLLVKYLEPKELNITNDFGLTPMHIATMSNDATTVAILMKRGADPTIISETFQGFNPIALAKQQKLNLIIDHIPKKSHVEIPSR